MYSISTVKGRPNTYRYRGNIKTFSTRADAERWAEYIDVEASGNCKRYVVYSVQNNTDIVKDFKLALDLYCTHHGAQQIAIQTRYQNLTPFTSEEEREVSWAPGLNYISARLDLSQYISLFPTVQNTATTINPLGGLKNRSKTTMVIGTNRQHVRSIPSNQGDLPTLLLGTGSITGANFRQASSVADRAIPGFQVGALVIAVFEDSGLFVWRHIEWKNDCFHDLADRWDVDGRSKVAPLVCMLGDWHAKEVTPDFLKVTEKILHDLKPTETIIQDAVTFEFGHWMTTRDRIRLGNMPVNQEFITLAEHLKRLTAYPTRITVIDSNHHYHVDSWVKGFTHELYPNDAEFYHELWLASLRNNMDFFTAAMKLVCEPSVFNKVNWLPRNAPFQPGSWAYYHGHAGPTGGKGGPGAFDNYTHRIMHGHTHSVGRRDNWLCVGTSGELAQPFHSVGDACMHAHGLEYPNGTATHLPVIQIGANYVWR